jgi:eukaryotic-like serine/threonine-protein kinase
MPRGAELRVRRVGPYSIHHEIAAGGMASVHLGRRFGAAGFSRTVAIKRLHAQFAKDPEFVAMLIDEARITGRLRHPNVVPTLDVVSADGELLLVMEYVTGESLARLLATMRARGELVPPAIVATIISGVLHGLHAAHEALSETGEPLCIVHRDVSPQNVIVGAEGVPRLLDFGIAKATSRIQTTREGALKGKPRYMAPEQLSGDADVGRAADIWAISVVLWEALTCQRLFDADNEHALVHKILTQRVDPPTRIVAGLPEVFDEVIGRGLQKDPSLRYATAREMALALEGGTPTATASLVAAWIDEVAGEALSKRAAWVAGMEREVAGEALTMRAAWVAGMEREGAATPASLAIQPPAFEREAAGADRDATTELVGASTPAPLPAAARTSQSLRWFVAALAAIIAVAVFVDAFRTRTSAEPITSNDGEPAAEAHPAAAALAPLPSSTGPAAPGTGAFTAAAPVVRQAPRSATTASVARPTPVKPAPASPKPKCNPPYTVDRDGIQHMKRECL